MNTITIHNTLPQNTSYPVFIGSGILGKISKLINLQLYSTIIILVDVQVKHLLQKIGNIRQTTVIPIPSGDINKTITNVQLIWDRLTASSCDRKSLLINLGGGVICDMGGFAASTYMRGIDFIQIPTTLLAQVDASVGGKVAVNYNETKNLIGSFQQPAAVVIDTDTLQTLPKREFISGFAEIIKHGLIQDREYFNFVTSKKPEDFNERELVSIIESSVLIKKNIIEKDPQELGLRKLLNFGHTAGHALEALSQLTAIPLLHGEAVGIGMAFAAKLSTTAGFLDTAKFEKIIKALRQAGLPVDFPDIAIDKIKRKMLSDKKNIKGALRWTLLKDIGDGTYDREIDDETVDKCLISYRKRILL